MTGSNGANSLIEQQRIFHDLLLELIPDDENTAVSDRISLFRRSDTSEVHHGESSLALCMIAGGSKQVLLGDSVFTYDKDHYFVTSMELPTASYVSRAAENDPYLGVRLLLDPETVRSVLLAGQQPITVAEDTSAFNVTTTTAELIDAMVRLLRVHNNPRDAEVLAPLIEREIIYRLLTGNHGGRLVHIAGLSPTTQGITRALEWLRTEYHQPLRVPEIARDCGMSVSSFHVHFKRVTGMTPLQFQKNLRLREARRLLLNEDIDVTNAGFRVGYNDASHFNRDYKKLFGKSPMRDVQSLRIAGPLAVAPN